MKANRAVHINYVKAHWLFILNNMKAHRTVHTNYVKAWWLYILNMVKVHRAVHVCKLCESSVAAHTKLCESS